MIYIDVTQTNEFTLNINNNVRDWLGDSNLLTFIFTHILSGRRVATIAPIDPVPPIDPNYKDFFGSFNGRYTEFYMTGPAAASYMIYDGEYDILIRNDNNEILYKGIWKVTGNSSAEENPFVEYESDNEDNRSYIYIEE